MMETLWLMVHCSPYLADGIEDDPDLRKMACWTDTNPRQGVVEKVITTVLPLADPAKYRFRTVHLALHVLSAWFTKYPHSLRASVLSKTIAPALLPSAAPSAAAKYLAGSEHVPYPSFYPTNCPTVDKAVPPAQPVAPPGNKRENSIFTKLFSSGSDKTVDAGSLAKAQVHIHASAPLRAFQVQMPKADLLLLNTLHPPSQWLPLFFPSSSSFLPPFPACENGGTVP